MAQTHIVSGPPNVIILNSGSGTYVPSPGTRWIHVKMCGAGAGGSGSGTTISTTGMTAGGATTFGPHTANGGAIPSSGIQGGGGGGGTIGAGANGYLYVGTPGGGSCNQLTTFAACSGMGGSSYLGGGGPGTYSGNPGVAGQGYGGGGSGGGMTNGVAGVTGAGGGGGGTLELFIPSPAASYAWTIGLPGIGASAGASGNIAGSGIGGVIYIEEYQ